MGKGKLPILSEKQRLLPLPRRQAVDASLVAHLSLVACRTGRGSRHLLFELVHTTYLSYLLCSQGYGPADRNNLYSAAERELDEAARRGYESDVWQVNAEADASIRPILRVYDWQLERVPVTALVEAKKKLRQLFA